MSLKSRIVEDMKAAMRAREPAKLSTIRMLLAGIKQKEVDERVDELGVGHEHLPELPGAKEAQLVEHPRAEACARPHRTDRRKLLLEGNAYRARRGHARMTVSAHQRVRRVRRVERCPLRGDHR